MGLLDKLRGTPAAQGASAPAEKKAAAPRRPVRQKLCLIAVRDYPPEKYEAYWEIHIDPDTWSWRAKIIHVTRSVVLAERTGSAADEEGARRESQTWVLNNMHKYKRGGEA